MNMTEVKTADLAGPALDWAAAKAEGVTVRVLSADNPGELWQVQKQWRGDGPYWPSTDWAQGGPLIDSCMIDVTQCPGRAKTHKARAVMDSSFLDKMGLRQRVSASGPTALIAACRAIVAAKLGDVVSVPSELLDQTK